VIIRQDRFLQAGLPRDDENNAIWRVPLFLVTRDSNGKAKLDRDLILADRDMMLKVELKDCLFNSGNSGFYRVLYPPTYLQLLAETAHEPFSLLKLPDRIKILSDSLAFATSGLAKTSELLGVCQSWKWDQTFMGKYQLASVTEAVRSVFWEQSDIYEGIGNLRKDMFKDDLSRLGFDRRPNESDEEAQLRVLVIEALADAREPTVIKELQTRFEQFKQHQDPHAIHSGLFPVTFQTVIRNGGMEEWEFILNIFTSKEEKFVTLTKAALSGLTCPKDPTLLQRTFGLVPTIIKGNELLNFFRFLNRKNVEARKEIAKFFYNDFERIMEEVSSFMQPYLLQAALSSQSSDADSNEIEEFFRERDQAAYKHALSQLTETTRVRAAWVKNGSDDMRNWLKTSGYL